MRTTTKSLRLSEAEAAAWSAAADQAGLSFSNWLRRCVAAASSAEAAVTRRPKPQKRKPLKAAAPKADPELLRQLAWIGNNLNQIAHVANREGDLPTLVQLAAIERDLKCISSS